MPLLALPFLAAAAVTGADPVMFDVQCVIVTQTAMQDQSIKPELKAMLMSAVTYFSGRVDAETSTADLETRLVAGAKAIEGQPVGPLLKECGDFMSARGKAWTDMGGRIEAREKASHNS
ncbi:MAG: hypothetical protein ACJ8F4_06540 [Sphingomonas sp.]